METYTEEQIKNTVIELETLLSYEQLDIVDALQEIVMKIDRKIDRTRALEKVELLEAKKQRIAHLRLRILNASAVSIHVAKIPAERKEG